MVLFQTPVPLADLINSTDPTHWAEIQGGALKVYDVSTVDEPGWYLNGKRTVQFRGKCYHASAVNYSMWGLANRLCYNTFKTWIHSYDSAQVLAYAWKIAPPRFGSQWEEAASFTSFGYFGSFLPNIPDAFWVGRPNIALRNPPITISSSLDWLWKPSYPKEGGNK